MEEEKRYNNNNRSRGNRSHRGPRPGFGHRTGRQQRPLLTSSINASGLCLVALVLTVTAVGSTAAAYTSIFSGAVVAFALSAIVSYFAQRASSKKWVEKVSDLFFFVGIVLVIYAALGLGNFFSTAMM